MKLLEERFDLFFNDLALQKFRDECLTKSVKALQVKNGNIPKWTQALDAFSALSEGQLTEVVQNELNSLSKLLSLSYEQPDLIRKKYYLIALKTPYTLFGVSPNSSNAEVKKAYHQMVMAYHPDKTAHLGEDEAQKAHLKFLEIMEAYKELENERGII